MISEAVTSSKLVEDWATLTTEAWTNEVKFEWKKKQRCETLARFRSSKKKKFADMVSERDQLEREVKRRLAALNAIASSRPDDEQIQSITSAICRLGLESDALRNENLEIHQKLQHLKRCWSLIQERFVVLQDCSDACSSTLNVYEASEKSQWVSNPVSEPSWRVHFSNGEPSFYFHPFTRGEFDAIHEHLLDEFHVSPPQIEPVGSLFGWTIHHAPITRRPEDNTVIAHAQLNMRAGFSVEEVDELVLNSDLKWLPLLVTPPNWNDNQREAVSSQVLQKFEMDAYIMVCNIPGAVHLRYLHLVRRQPLRLPDGKRAITYSLAIIDSAANARSRVAAEPEHNVLWAYEGSSLLTVTEVDEKTVDIKFEFKAVCQDELHARHLFVYWTQFVCRWSQKNLPLQLLQSSDEETN